VRRAEALIVGGGPAGAAAAVALARAGIAVDLFERNPGPHEIVCGGFLGWDALAALARLGIDAAALGARPITRLRLFSPDREVEAALPRAASGLSRRTLDSALLAAAEQAGARVHRGIAARSADPARRSVRLDDGGEAQGEALLIATGKHELRGSARDRDTRGDPVGVRTAFAPSPALALALDGIIELHLFEGGYAGLLLQEDGDANLCLSAARHRLKAAGSVEGLIASIAGEHPALRSRLQGKPPSAWTAIAGIPYGWRAGQTSAQVYRIGDQAVVIASLAGDGIAIALASGRAAAAAIAGGEGAEAFQAAFSARAARPVGIAEALRWAAERRLPRNAAMRLLAAYPTLSGAAAGLTRIGV
jgi:menaquinone-9 beta-reductase